MKKQWSSPEVLSLELTQTMKDLQPGTKEDSMSWQNGFQSWECDCS